jgi:hypothetical protein
LSLLLAAAQAVMSVPATPAPALPSVTSGYSIVVARSVTQGSPIPIQCGAPNCTSWFLGKFDRSRTLAGLSLPAKFEARLEMGSPFDQQYRMLLLIAREADGTLRIRSDSGFNTRTKEACLDTRATDALTPPPAGPGLFRRGRAICTIDR